MTGTLTILTFLILLSPIGVSASEDSTTVQSGVIKAAVAPLRVDDGGNLIVAVFRDEDSWLELESAFHKLILPVETDSVNVVFEEIPFGEYAISVIHDKNENGKFDMRWFPWPKPKEGAGVSNNNRRKGKPKYDKALFTVAEDTVSLRIEMAY